MTDSISVDEYEAMLKKEKRPKYNNRKVHAEGRVFDSEEEYKHYVNVLKLRLLEGSIKDLEFQPAFELVPGYRRLDGKKIRNIIYKADFAFLEVSDGQRTVQDVKAVKTPIFKLKMKILQWKYPDLRFEIIDVERKSRGK